MSTSLIEILLSAQLLTLIFLLTALPWVAALHRGLANTFKSRDFWSIALAANVGGVMILGYLMYNFRSTEKLAEFGRYYGTLAHINLGIDLFVIVFAAMLAFWPKGGAVALAAFRESIRQPMFWLIAVLSTCMLIVSMVVPYFTFGEDYKVMKQMGFDIIMFASLLFGLLSVSISIHEEIEGRTAITVISKPINRRQFLMGKYFGILLACGAMTMTLGWVLTWVLNIQPQFNKLDDVNDFLANSMTQVVAPAFDKVGFTPEGRALFHGVGSWFGETLAHHLGLLLSFGQVMVLLAISAALATRMQFAVNIVICLLVFLLGHLAPVLVEVTKGLVGGGSSPLMLVSFIAQLFNVVFPALDYFQVGPAIIRDNPIPIFSFLYYVLSVLAYAILYSSLAILVGLLLFEDRDLA